MILTIVKELTLDCGSGDKSHFFGVQTIPQVASPRDLRHTHYVSQSSLSCYIIAKIIY